MSTTLSLSNYNNCNVIRGVGDAVDVLAGNDFSNISNIYLTASVNNCEVANYDLTFTNNSIVLPDGAEIKTVCEDIQSCQTNLTYSNVYADLKTPINVNTTLTHNIRNTSTTISFCGIEGTTDLGSNILGFTFTLPNITLQTSTIYNSGSVDESALIKNEIESLFNLNNISFNNIVVSQQIGVNPNPNIKGTVSSYNIIINTSVQMGCVINTSVNNVTMSVITNCSAPIYGFNHKRSSFTISNYNNTNSELIKWYTSKPWDYNTATGVFIESYNDTTLNITYNVQGSFYVYMEVTTNDAQNQTILYEWVFNANNQQLVTPVPTKSQQHYEIIPNGDLTTIQSVELSGANCIVNSGTNCINYLHLKPSFFNVDAVQSINDTVFPDGIYAVHILIVYNDHTPNIDCQDSVFLDCVVKCAVADCVYATKSYELMTIYNAIKALDGCDTHYTAEMSELFIMLINSLCYDANYISTSLNQDCGCN